VSPGDTVNPVVRRLRPGEGAECEAVLRSLPAWFGIEQAILDYRRDVDTLETWVAEIDGRPVGFLTLKHHNPHTSEIQVMAIREEAHRRGAGRALVAKAEERARERGSTFLEVKTLGPSRPDPNYDETRRFYVAVGFSPLEENSLWGGVNPCLILVKHLACSGNEVAPDTKTVSYGTDRLC